MTYGTTAHKAIAEDIKTMIKQSSSTKVYTNSKAINTIVNESFNISETKKQAISDQM